MQLIRQHLIDPELCTACLSCLAACRRGAVMQRDRVVAIDPALCIECADCLDECATGAIDTWRMVRPDMPYTLEEQFRWDRVADGLL